MTETQSNEAVVRELIQALFTRGDLSAVDRYVAEDFVMHDPPFGVSPDREGMRAAARTIRAAFPDWHSDLHHLVADGDLVAEHFTASGTHRGEVLGVPPSGRTVTLPGMNLFRLDDGVVVEWWSRLDMLGFLSQLGVVRTADAAAVPA